MIEIINKILRWWASVAGRNSWFTYDKFCHFALHIIITRALRTHCGLAIWQAGLISIAFGIIYEIITYPFERNLGDSLRDIVWNLAGMVVGAII